MAKRSPGCLSGTGSNSRLMNSCQLLIDRVAVQFVPGLVEVVHAQAEDQILTAAENRVIGDPDFFQLGQQLRPDALVLALVLFDGVRLDAQFERVAGHTRL